MTVEDLKKRAEMYFKKGEKKMYATEDGNLFYEHDKTFGEAHARRIKRKLHTIEPEPKKTASKANAVKPKKIDK